MVQREDASVINRTNECAWNTLNDTASALESARERLPVRVKFTLDLLLAAARGLHHRRWPIGVS